MQCKPKCAFVGTHDYCCSIAVQSAHKWASCSIDRHEYELIIVLYISLITYPQHTNYIETTGLSVVGRFMMLVLFYVQLQQPGPEVPLVGWRACATFFR